MRKNLFPTFQNMRKRFFRIFWAYMSRVWFFPWGILTLSFPQKYGNDFFRSPTLTACRFAVLWDRETHNTSLEISKPSLRGHFNIQERLTFKNYIFNPVLYGHYLRAASFQDRPLFALVRYADVQWCQIENQQNPVYDMKWGHFDRVNSTFKMLLSTWNLNTVCKKIRSFDAENLGSVD